MRDVVPIAELIPNILETLKTSVEKEMSAARVIIRNVTIIENAAEYLQSEIINRLTFINPKWLDNDRMGRYQGNTPHNLKFYEKSDNVLMVPRGFTGQLLNLVNKHGYEWEIDEQTRRLSPVELEFKARLRNYQQSAVNAMLSQYFGVLVAPTGSGKTVMALAIIAARKQPALIVVHTKELLNQWIERIERFLGIPREEIGIIGNGKKTIGQRITVATVQSLYKCADEVSRYIGHLVVDECHKAPSRTFTEAVTAFDSAYMLGLSATPYRRDKLSRLIFYHLGDVQHEVPKELLIENGSILKAEIITRETDFSPYSDPVNAYSRMMSELTADEPRNRMIAADVVREASESGGTLLVLSDRKGHCETLKQILADQGHPADVLTGGTGKKERAALVERLNTGKVKTLIATGQLIGEGFDCPQLSSLFLTTPIKFSGRLLQYIGRVLRPAAGKTSARVFDYVDVKVGVLVASAKARARVYG